MDPFAGSSSRDGIGLLLLPVLVLREAPGGGGVVTREGAPDHPSSRSTYFVWTYICLHTSLILHNFFLILILMRLPNIFNNNKIDSK